MKTLKYKQIYHLNTKLYTYFVPYRLFCKSQYEPDLQTFYKKPLDLYNVTYVLPNLIQIALFFGKLSNYPRIFFEDFILSSFRVMHLITGCSHMVVDK